MPVQTYTVTDQNGRPVLKGDAITSFRGETWTFRGVSRGPSLGKSAKVLAVPVGGSFNRELYAGVFNLTVSPR